MKKLFRMKNIPGCGAVATNRITPGCDWALDGKSTAVEMIDGEVCALVSGRLFRLDMRHGRLRAEDIYNLDGGDDDKATSLRWIPVDNGEPKNKWYTAAYLNTPWVHKDGVYIAVGLHFCRNPYGLDEDFLERPYRIHIHESLRTFDDIWKWFSTHDAKGIVFIGASGEKCYVERTDFNLPWPVYEFE